MEAICEAFLLLPEAQNYESVLQREALCSSALTRYGRVFATGVRSGVTADQRARLTPEHQDWHVFYKDLRDKWIAHSVNAFEENSVVAYLVPPERGAPQVSSISVQRRRVASLSSGAMQALRELCSSLRAIVESDAEIENARVLQHARSLPPADFYAQEAPQASQVGDAEVSKPRRKFDDA